MKKIVTPTNERKKGKIKQRTQKNLTYTFGEDWISIRRRFKSGSSFDSLDSLSKRRLFDVDTDTEADTDAAAEADFDFDRLDSLSPVKSTSFSTDCSRLRRRARSVLRRPCVFVSF